MTISRHRVSLRTYALAFAVVLSPVLMQTSSCGGSYTLSELEVIVDSRDRIVGFDPAVRSYEIGVTAGADIARVRAIPTSPGAEVWLAVDNDSSGPSTTPALVGGGEFTIALDPGQSTLTVNVKSGGLTSFYTVGIGRGLVFPCTEQGIYDAIAAGGGAHTFDCDGPTTVVLSQPNGAIGELLIDNDVILDGEAQLTIEGDATLGANSVWISPETTVELRGLTLKGTGSCSCGGGGRGCGIFGCYCFCLGAGVYNEGTLTLVDSVITGNLGDGVSSPGALTLINTTVSGNEGHGVIGNSITVENSTVSQNWYGIAGQTLTLTNSTVSGNSFFSVLGFGTATMANTIIDGGCGGLAISLGQNIESPGDTCGFDQPTDQINVTAEQLALGPLGNNGGPTPTHALSWGSVAIDWISGADCVDADGAPVRIDQRGVTRPQGGGCDVGAFEYTDCTGSVCDDGDECTADYCDPLAEIPWCVNINAPDGTSCDFGGLAGVCGAGTCIEDHCVDPTVCDDGEECTTDTCDPFSSPWCSNLPVPNGTVCDFLGLTGVCHDGSCIEDHCVDPAVCDDGNECTTDTCDPLTVPWCSNAPGNTGGDCNAPGGLGVCANGGCVESSWGTAELVETNPEAVFTDQGQAVADPSGNVIGVWVQGGTIWSNRYEPGIGWGVAEMIGSAASRPQLAVDPTGVVTAVWVASNGIWSNRYTPELGWGVAEPVEPGESTNNHEPRVAVDSSGIATVVWFRYDGGPGYDIWSNRYTPGVGWGVAEMIASLGSDRSDPWVAADPTGNVTVVWHTTDIWANRYEPGVGWGVAEMIGSAGSAPRVEVDPTGVATAVWATSAGIWSNRYTPGVGWGIAENVASAGTNWPDMLTSVDAAGRVTVVWAANGDVWVNRYTPGVGWGVAEVMGAGGSYPWVTAEPGGRAMAVWATDVGSESELVWSRRYTPGVGWAAAEPIRGARPRTLVVMDSSGAVTAGWVASYDLWSNRSEAP